MRKLLGAAMSGTTDAVRKQDLIASNITGLAVSANPSASLGLAAINGSATSWMRSDAAPALDVGITPTWNKAHTFSPTTGVGITITAATTYSAASFTSTASAAQASTVYVHNTNSLGTALYVDSGVTALVGLTASTGAFSGSLAANLGLTVAGAAFTSRGITDNATATAITIGSAKNVTLAAPTSGTTLGLTSVSAGVALNIVSGSAGTLGQGDIAVNRAGSTANQIAQGPNLILADTTNSTQSCWQNSGGQTELWQFNAAAWAQVLKVTTAGVVTVVTGFASRGITDNATATAVTISSTKTVTHAQPTSGVALTITGAASGSGVVSILDAQSATGANASLTIARAGSTINNIAQGPGVMLFDSTATTYSMLQHAGGQTELWQYNAGWNQILKVATTRGVTISAPASGATLNLTSVSANVALNIVSGSAGTLGQNDVIISRAGSTINQLTQGANLILGDSTNITSTCLQQSGGQTELWQYNASVWNQIWKVPTTGGLVINAPVSGAPLTVIPIAAGNGIVITGTDVAVYRANAAASTNRASTVYAQGGTNRGQIGSDGTQAIFTDSVDGDMCVRAMTGTLRLGAGTASQVTLTSAGKLAVAAPASGTTLGLTGASNALVLDAYSGGPTSGYSAFTGWLTVGTSAGDYPFVGYNVASTTSVGVGAYKVTDFASRITFPSGGIALQTAPSGTAAANITFTTALSVSQSGNVNIPNGSGSLSPVYAGVPQNSQVGNYTLVLGDANKHIIHNSVSAHTFTIPANASVAYPIGTAVTIVNPTGSGVITIAITTDSMQFYPTGTTGSRTLAASGQCSILKLTATTWSITGVGLT